MTMKFVSFLLIRISLFFQFWKCTQWCQQLTFSLQHEEKISLNWTLEFQIINSIADSHKSSISKKNLCRSQQLTTNNRKSRIKFSRLFESRINFIRHPTNVHAFFELVREKYFEFVSDFFSFVVAALLFRSFSLRWRYIEFKHSIPLKILQ